MSKINDTNLLDVGIFRVNNLGVVVYGNSRAQRFLNLKETFIGERVEKVIPGFIIPREANKLSYQAISIDCKEILVSSLLLEGADDLDLDLVVVLHDLDRKSYSIQKGFSLPVRSFLELAEIIVKKDLMITDGQGKILKFNFSSEEIYQVKTEDMLGKNVFDLNRQGILFHYATMMVIKEMKEVKVIHYNKLGIKLLITGVPMFKDNELQYVLSYGSWDFNLNDHLILQEKYEEMQNLLERYTAEIEDLRSKAIQFTEITSQSQQMQNILKTVVKVAEVNTNVVITGESGVGKSLIARLIHQKSFCKKGPFIEINCGAIPESLIESELFGYEGGAFTGASQKGKIGEIALADGGTLFLDEIGELPFNMQVKLLNVIQERKITKVGGTNPVHVNFRLITATNKNLEELVREGCFREDLFYRLNVVPIHIPPLRERPDDLFPLIMDFLTKANKRFKTNKKLSHQAIDMMMQYNWPGNTRQLQNYIERLVLMVEEEYISVQSLPNSSTLTLGSEENVTLNDAVRHCEKQLIKQAYAKYRTTIGVAKALGISQPTAVRKIKKYILK